MLFYSIINQGQVWLLGQFSWLPTKYDISLKFGESGQLAKTFFGFNVISDVLFWNHRIFFGEIGSQGENLGQFGESFFPPQKKCNGTDERKMQCFEGRAKDEVDQFMNESCVLGCVCVCVSVWMHIRRYFELLKDCV